LAQKVNPIFGKKRKKSDARPINSAQKIGLASLIIIEQMTPNESLDKDGVLRAAPE
jgi:hypothetical protein